jgi:hypothetical protein
MPRYDLFQLNGGSWPLWVGAAESMGDAQAQADQLPEFLLLDYLTDDKITLKARRSV